MNLKDVQLRRTFNVQKPTKLSDGGGLYLLVSPQGSKWWRLDYRLGAKRKTISLGTYPDVGLADARERRDQARKQVAAGIDPSNARKAAKAAAADRDGNSFEVVAREWFQRQSRKWVPKHSSKIIARLEKDIFPLVGKRPVSEVTAKELLGALGRLEARSAFESAHRALQNCNQIFRYAISTGRAAHNPASDLRGALSPVVATHRAAITDPRDIGGLMRALDDYRGSAVVRCALRLAPLLFVRPGELRGMEWAEVDLEAREWNIPASKMKMREPHLVPLSRQALAILEGLHLLTGNGRFAFPSPRSAQRPMSDNAVLSALRRMGFAKDEMSGHGFRAMARTVLDEVLHVRPDYIEHQLAHAVKDPNGRAYNRTAHLTERTEMMQRWADYLDALKLGGNVLAFRRA